MSCSISNSSQQLPGFAIRDISMSDPATELIPSPNDPKLLFAIVPIILLGLTIMPLIWLHFIKCRYPGVGSQFSILNYCSTDSKRVSILINLTPAHYIMASLKGAMPLIMKFPFKQVFNIQYFIVRVAMVPSAYYYIPIPALFI
jgi:hypothetical protein